MTNGTSNPASVALSEGILERNVNYIAKESAAAAVMAGTLDVYFGCDRKMGKLRDCSLLPTRNSIFLLKLPPCILWEVGETGPEDEESQAIEFTIVNNSYLSNDLFHTVAEGVHDAIYERIATIAQLESDDPPRYASLISDSAERCTVTEEEATRFKDWISRGLRKQTRAMMIFFLSTRRMKAKSIKLASSRGRSRANTIQILRRKENDWSSSPPSPRKYPLKGDKAGSSRRRKLERTNSLSAFFFNKKTGSRSSSSSPRVSRRERGISSSSSSSSRKEDSQSSSKKRKKKNKSKPSKNPLSSPSPSDAGGVVPIEEFRKIAVLEAGDDDE